MDSQRPARSDLARRSFLRGATLVAGAGTVGGAGLLDAGPLQPRAAEATTDYGTRAAFDALDLGFNNGDGLKNDTNDQFGNLGWGESYVLQAYLLMYEARRDGHYLDKAIDHIDSVLANRDTARGVTDWRGLSLPGWRLGHPYSCGELFLTDAAGRRVLRLRSARAYSQLIQITVGEGSTPGTFRIYAKHPLPSFNKPGDPCEETHDNLTMDPASADYVVKRLWDGFSINDVQLTAKDLRPDPAAGGNPVAVQATMTDPKFHSSVHTGQIAYPIAKFARLVATTPALRSQQRLRAKADEYASAALAALRIHDEEVRDIGRGREMYGYLKGAPVNLDGSDLPHNYTASMARAWVELAMARPGHQAVRQRAERLTRTFHSDLTRLTDGTASWTYYWTGGDCYRGWDRSSGLSENMPAIGAGTRGEDVSHGHIETTLAITAHRAGLAFTTKDLRMLAKTFTDKVLKVQDGRLVTSTWVDGSGTTTGYRQIAVAWLGLAPYATRASLVSDVNQMFADTGPVPNVVPIYASAWLNWASQATSS